MKRTTIQAFAALALSTGLMAAAHADSENFVLVTPVANATNAYTGSFNAIATGAGSFTDIFDFSGAPPSTDMFFSVGANDGISFSSFTLTYWGGDGTALPLDSSTVLPGSINASVAGEMGGAYSLIITGTATGAGNTYSLAIGENVGVSAVPEPPNWALMLGGLGLTAGFLRRRMRSS